MGDVGLGWQWDAEWLILAPIAIFIWVFPLWRIVGKAGYPPVLSLLAIVPLMALLLLWWLALARWPLKDDRIKKNSGSTL